jgi:hypothetical protein
LAIRWIVAAASAAYSASRQRLVTSADPTTSGTASITWSGITSYTGGYVQPGQGQVVDHPEHVALTHADMVLGIDDMVASKISAPSTSRSTSPG